MACSACSAITTTATEVPRVLRRAGVIVLNDSRHAPVGARSHDRPARTRLLDASAQHQSSRLVRAGRPFTIMLAHDPRRVYEASALDIPLVLSGHTHGGQVSLPLIGAPGGAQVPGRGGTARVGSTRCSSAGAWARCCCPCRIDCPPEVAVVTLCVGPPRPDVSRRRSVGPRRATRRRAPARSPPDRGGAPARGCAPQSDVRGVVFEHGNGRLRHNRPCVEFGRDQVHGGAGHLDAVGPGLTLGVDAGKGRQQ